MADPTTTTTATTTQTSPVPAPPVKAAAAATIVPPGERYRFHPWHTALLLVLAIILDLPFRIDQLCGAYYHAPPAGGILISGASTGIGRDAAVALATKEKNYVIFAGVRSSKDIKALSQLGLKNLVPVTLDVTSESSINSAYKAIMKDLGKRNLPFVGLVNNAGISSNSPLEFHASTEVEKIFQVNVFGLLKMTQKFLPDLRKSKGRVINISSVLGALTVPEYGAYCASKHAMESLSDGLRRELKPLGVSVSIVQPGFVQSPIHTKILASKKTVVPAASAIYNHIYTEKKEKDMLQNIQHASSTKCTSNAIAHALLSTYPRARYPVAAVSGMPAGIVTAISYFLPDRVTDFLLVYG